MCLTRWLRSNNLPSVIDVTAAIVLHTTVSSGELSPCDIGLSQ